MAEGEMDDWSGAGPPRRGRETRRLEMASKEVVYILNSTGPSAWRRAPSVELDPSWLYTSVSRAQTNNLLPGLAVLPCRAAWPCCLACLLGGFRGARFSPTSSEELRGGRLRELSCRWAELELAQAGYPPSPLQLSQDTEAVEAPRHRGTENQQAPGKSSRSRLQEGPVGQGCVAVLSSAQLTLA